ncbi:hypothetical protein [Streptomyces sp. 769]|uniref:hypothetical protein n=1 Tax=Streptomyces sp. 769 TaxID=1262452 RepID=UPI00069080AF|nr:hypothetical protein [Streptomyces sp. 769]
MQVRQALNARGNRFPTWVATVSAMQVGTAAFAAAMVEGPIEARIMDEVRTVQATGPQLYANAGKWLTAFWLSSAVTSSG